MKIQLDTNLKVIRLEESVSLGELAEMLNKLLPNNEWKNYKLEVTVLNNWLNPIVIKEYPVYPSYPWWQPIGSGTPIVTYTSGTTNGGTFNIQVDA